MFMTHTNSVLSEAITLIDYIPEPQYVHQVSDGGILVRKGLRVMPGELVRYVLDGKYGAAAGTSEFIRDLTGRPNCRVGLILASGNTLWSGYLSGVTKSDRYPTHKMQPMGVSQIFAGQLATGLGSFEYIATDSTSCISGHSAWYTARNMMKLDLLDAVVVVATDNGASEDYLEAFREYGITKLAKEEGNPSVVKFRLGQGCNVSVFEKEAMLNITKHTPLALILDMHVTAEMHTNPLGISRTGDGYNKVMSRVDTTGVEFIKTHSTFSANNAVEQDLITQRFGGIRTLNYKLRIGHTMGASTAVETALAIQEESGRFLSLGAGMGNVFSSAVVEILK